MPRRLEGRQRSDFAELSLGGLEELQSKQSSEPTTRFPQLSNDSGSDDSDSRLRAGSEPRLRGKFTRTGRFELADREGVTAARAMPVSKYSSKGKLVLGGLIVVIVGAAGVGYVALERSDNNVPYSRDLPAPTLATRLNDEDRRIIAATSTPGAAILIPLAPQLKPTEVSSSTENSADKPELPVKPTTEPKRGPLELERNLYRASILEQFKRWGVNPDDLWDLARINYQPVAEDVTGKTPPLSVAETLKVKYGSDFGLSSDKPYDELIKELRTRFILVDMRKDNVEAAIGGIIFIVKQHDGSAAKLMNLGPNPKDGMHASVASENGVLRASSLLRDLDEKDFVAFVPPKEEIKPEATSQPSLTPQPEQTPQPSTTPAPNSETKPNS